MTMLDDWPRVKALFEQALAAGRDGTTGISRRGVRIRCPPPPARRRAAEVARLQQSFLETTASAVLELGPSRRPERSDARHVSTAVAHRRGRDGRGLSGPRRQPRSPCRRQADRETSRRRCGPAATVSAGSASGFQSQPSKFVVVHDFGEMNGPPVHRHRAGRRRDAAGAAQGGAAADPRTRSRLRCR